MTPFLPTLTSSRLGKRTRTNGLVYSYSTRNVRDKIARFKFFLFAFVLRPVVSLCYQNVQRSFFFLHPRQNAIAKISVVAHMSHLNTESRIKKPSRAALRPSDSGGDPRPAAGPPSPEIPGRGGGPPLGERWRGGEGFAAAASRTVVGRQRRN